MDLENATIRHTVTGIQFGFYTDDENRARSVCEIISPIAYDSLGNALPGGLYTPQLGPTNAKEGSCATCGMGYQGCPGHSGHIELCLPIYHPLLFGTLYKILKLKCLNCHNFRLKKTVVYKHLATLLLIKTGHLERALNLENEAAAYVKKARPPSTSQGKNIKSKSAKFDAKYADIAMKDFIESVLEDCKAAKEQPLTAHARMIYNGMKKNVISELSCQKCQNCGFISNKFRKDGKGGGKIFKCPLSLKSRKLNSDEKISSLPAKELEKKLALKGLSIEEFNSRLVNGSSLWRILSVDDDADSDDEDTEPNEANGQQADEFQTSLEIYSQLKLTWALNYQFCATVFNDAGLSHQVFFMNTVSVPPSRFRPPMVLGTMSAEHAQNIQLAKLLTLNQDIRKLMEAEGEKANNEEVAPAKKSKDELALEKTSKILQSWIALQNAVNLLISDEQDGNGIRQILERKEGMFRKHMMGKRVNFACRSVISPDPYLRTDEIGIPRKFAQILTLPTPINAHNITEMRQLICNGTKIYPGANWVEEAISGGGSSRRRKLNLERMDEVKRQALASRLVGNGTFVVGRQVISGDRLLLNRQPTLHKPGIMAHSARVLGGNEQTIRMHYANCNTYNADFDGDEMNAHLVQSQIAQAEARLIMGAELQYISGTDGGVLRGLIQDHVDAGVKMTHPSTFLNRSQYQQLVYAALVDTLRDNQDVICERGCVTMPKLGVELWSGKQVISTILHHLTPELYCQHKTKTNPALLGYGHEKVLVVDGELLRGILDKSAFGSSSFGLVHCVHESYGPEAASVLLSVLGRLFTFYLQNIAGHSCRMEDLVLTREADADRRELVKKVMNVGTRSSLAFARSDAGKSHITAAEKLSENTVRSDELSEASKKMKSLLTGPEGGLNSALLDSHMQSVVNPLCSSIIKACLPSGLRTPFPDNTFSLMVSTGAKGSMVNQSQVSCCLGSQALEGRRVPRMASGKTLPSFPPYCPTPRADGFISDRFLTGVRPQEYYFHCMAGREGLVDTAVKTSRSGYLQRCLVKHLEELKVCYDNTVRDAESNVIQFLYGEDGVDPTKAAHLDPSSSTLEYLARNYVTLKKQYRPLPDCSLDRCVKIARQAERKKKFKIPEFEDLDAGMFVQAKKLRVGKVWNRGKLCEGWFDATITKVNSDQTSDLIYHNDGTKASNVPIFVWFDRCGSKRTTALWNQCQLIRIGAPDPILSGTISDKNGFSVARLGQNGSCVSERVALAVGSALENDSALEKAMDAANITKEEFEKLVAAKYSSSLIAPGEAVGSIAAQSVGEPSTQMTLNTFHLAGAGANVTLGIPRLREIIMTASRNLKTPTMSVPLLPHISENVAKRIARTFAKLTLKELIASKGGITVRERLEQSTSGSWDRAYHVSLKLHPAERIFEAFGIEIKDIAAVITQVLIPGLAKLMKSEAKRTDSVSSLNIEGGEKSTYVQGDEGADANKRESSKTKKNRVDDDEYDDEQVGEEDGVMGARFGHKKEMASYGDMDAEDKEILEASERGNLNGVDDFSDSDDDAAPATVTDDEEEQHHSFSSNNIKIDSKKSTIILRPLKVNPSNRSFLMVGLVEKAAASTVVRSKPRIDQAFVNKEDGRGLCLQTAGINFGEIWDLKDVDHNQLSSNDIWAIRCAYGVEAARMSIVEQIRGVFAVYGISVDPRHLALIADYMTYDGDFKAMNRLGMANDSSAFVQMSFETTAVFLTEAALTMNKEILESPSANIVLGRPIKHGTGAFDCFAKS